MKLFVWFSNQKSGFPEPICLKFSGELGRTMEMFFAWFKNSKISSSALIQKVWFAVKTGSQDTKNIYIIFIYIDSIYFVAWYYSADFLLLLLLKMFIFNGC